jgi:SAM-dependent methyltransferase
MCEVEDWQESHIAPFARHRKNWEYEQLIYGLRTLQAIRPDGWVLAVGGGHEPPVFQLTNHVRWVFCTDLYETSSFQEEADGLMLRDPDRLAPCPYNRRRLIVQYMNALDLRYEDETFDTVFSLSSIEHFGGMECSKRALMEMARVLKPGGIAALTTEVVTNGAGHFSSDKLELFSPETLSELIESAGLDLVEPIDFRVSEATRATCMSLEQALAEPRRLPHIVLGCADREFTSISLFLRRPG